MGTWAVSWTRALGAVTLGVAALVACGDDDDAGESAADAEAAVVETSAAPVTTAAPETTEPAPETTEPAPETTEPAPETTERAAETTTVETTVASLTTESGAEPTLAPSDAEELPDGPLSAGTRYVIPGRASTITTSVEIEFTPPIDGLVAFAVPGFVGVSRDPAGLQPGLQIVALDRAEAIIDPAVDFANVSLPAPELVDDVPEDFLAWFGARPGITAGPITEVEFGGVPARQMTYQAGPVPGGFPCGPDVSKTCGAHLWVPSGVAVVTLEGDAGTLYEVVGGARVLIDIPEGVGSAELASSMTINLDAG